MVRILSIRGARWALTASLTVALAAALTGCSETWTPVDLDGDGVTPEDGDCDDLNAAVYPGADEQWYDGVDQDCDGNDGDQDGDGYVPSAYADDYSWEAFSAHAAVGDCDDTDASVSPEGVEVWYDCVDQDCDGNDGDQDGDGYVLSSYVDVCADWAAIHATGTRAGDCVDSDSDDPGWVDEDGLAVDWAGLGFGPADLHPGANEVCYDGVDADCGGEDDYDCDGDGDPRRLECDDADPTISFDPSIYDAPYDCIDADCDGNDGDQDGDRYVPDEYTLSCPTWRDFSWHLGAGDCWDDPSFADPDYTPALNGLPDLGPEDVYPNAPDVSYDAIDADCAGDTDFDVDQDGYESGSQRDRSGNFAGDDCDDDAAAINPGATELLADDVDQDCDGVEICYEDADGDGDGSTTAVAGRDVDCDDSGESYTSTDCDDDDAAVYLGAEELVADLVDEDCDGQELCYADGDADGYGGDSTVVSADLDCDDAGETYTDEDCDDADSAVNPDALDECTVNIADTTGVDDDCDGAVDEGDSSGTCWQQGDLLITEIALSPSTTPEIDGEWFEVLNRTSFQVDLMGIRLREVDGNENVYVGEHLTLDSGARAVFCYADNAVTQAAGCDYVYGGGVLNAESPLGASSNVDFELTDATAFNLRVQHVGSASGALNLDGVDYGTNGDWPAIVPGLSIELSETKVSGSVPELDNDLGSSWCAAQTGSGDHFYTDGASVIEYGTPGLANDCP